ncbi:Toluene tolerance family protein [Crenothrix polyspora]|uniref:Toluene tolerance family protein n=1 Tax=Crenothrix polyspora TaxID=360316 RepID=A0A1R4GZG9_9GAMM|nr:ABC transporter substrate-binding protein [Crenothrix polyspora]SJM89345.1 Toluene tolerance family protein [Crenothrix polyspora]
MKKQIQQHAVYGLLVILLSVIGMAKGAAESLQQPQQVIQNISDTLQKKLQDKSFTQNFASVVQFVKTVIDPHTDFDKISPLVLGKHWKTATPTEQEGFKQEFQTLLIRAYSRAFVEYNNWTISYLPVETASDAKKVIVKTKVMQPSIQAIEVNYRMFLSNGEWKVYDILIEGVSLVTTYRSTFSDEIQSKGSLSAVIDTLAKRNADALSAK